MMKFTAGLAISLILALPVHARAFFAKNDSTHSWKLGVLIAPGMAYRTLSILEDTPFMHSIVDSRNGNEVPRLNYSGTLLLEHRFTNLFSISGGAGYTVMGWQSEFSGFFVSDPAHPEGGSSDPAIPESVRYLQNFYYLDVPLMAQFTIGKRRFRSITSIGITTSFLLRANTAVSLTYSDGREDGKLQNENEEYNTIGLFPTFSTGVSYALNDRMDLRLEPTFRYGVPRVIEAPITANLWSGGVGFSFHYAL